MKKFSTILSLTAIFICLIMSRANAYIYVWSGGTSTAWELAANWTKTGTGTSTYPGEGGTTNDKVKINTSVSFTNQPLLSANVTIASLILGTKTACTLTVNGALNVTGDIALKNNNLAGGITTVLTGSGSIKCVNFYLGDDVTPPLPVLNLANQTWLTTLNFSLSRLTVRKILYLTTTSKKNTIYGRPTANVNNPVFNFDSGTISAATIQTIDNYDADVPAIFAFGAVSSSAQFLMAPSTGNSSTLNLSGENALILDGSAGYVDLYGTAGGVATVNYNGSLTGQEIYTTSAPYSSTRQSPNGLDQSPRIYQNLTFSGSLAKTADIGDLAVGGDLTLAPGTETVDLAANNTLVTIGGNFTSNSGTGVNQGSGLISISGNMANMGSLNLGTGGLTLSGNYNNTGGYAQTTGITLFNGNTAQTLQDGSSTGTQFNTVNFSGAGLKTMASGNFSVSSTSVMTMIGSSTLAAGGNLTLKSDSTGSATVAAMPLGASISGNVNVERYVTGGTLGNRAYRLMSSPVNAGGGAYSINYLKNSIFLTGTTSTAGGFDFTGGYNNPTLYLYRENLAPLYTTFLNSNWRGINNLNAAPDYTLDIDGGPFNILVGNGYMCFFRGSRTTLNPFVTTTVPVAAILTATGTLNQGQIMVKNWYTPTSAYLGYTTLSGLTSIQGFNLVGNPYASSIDWDQYSATDPSANIYAPHVNPSIYMLNAGSHNYGVYNAAAHLGVNNATNIIPSGVGFFIKAKSDSAQLIFSEGAKVNTQVTGPNLFMGKPVATANMQYIRLQMAKDAVNTDETVISFNAGAKTDFNPLEDSQYVGGQGRVALSSISNDHIGLAINQLPLSAKTQAIAIKVNADSDGIYTLNITELKSIPQLYDIWLMDAYKKDSLDMRANKTYAFNIYKNDTTSFGSGRFCLMIRQNPAFSLKLLGFNAAKIPVLPQVQVTWKTENEQNYTHFTVERSTDGGKTFDVLGGMLSSGQGTYSLLDKKPVTGQNFYRLKQEDINVAITYSKVVMVSYSDLTNSVKSLVSIYPNPASGLVHILVDSKAQQTTSYNIIITNNTGAVVKKAVAHQSLWQGSVNNLPPGTYIVNVTNGNNNSLVGKTKFVKL